MAVDDDLDKQPETIQPVQRVPRRGPGIDSFLPGLNNEPKRPGEPGFGVNTEDFDEAQQEEQDEGSQRDRLEDLHEKYKKQKKQPSQAGKAAEEAEETGAKIARAGSTAVEAGELGAEAAAGVGETAAIVGAEAGAAATGVGIPVAVALVVLDVVRRILKNRFIRRVLLGIGILLIAWGILLFAQAIARHNDVYLFGPHPAGGSGTQPQIDSRNAAVAAGQGGLVTGPSIQSMNIAFKSLSDQLDKHPPKGANVSQAKQIISQIQALQAPLTTQGAIKHEDAAKTTAQMRTLMKDLVNAIYPGRTGAQQKVIAMVGSSVKVQNGGGCTPLKDINSLALTQNLYNVIAAAGQQMTVTVNCLVSGHRKYVGYPPSDGFPRCGDPRVLQGNVSVSAHCLGRAVDFTPTPALEKYLRDHQSELHILHIKHEKVPNHLHIEVLPDTL